jgi:hypothetical protein
VTEKQWLRSRDPGAMIDHLGDVASERKLRLFAVACCERVADLLLDPRSLGALRAAERLTEGKVKGGVWRERKAAADAWYDDAGGQGSKDARWMAVQVIVESARGSARTLPVCALAAIEAQERLGGQWYDVRSRRGKAERAVHPQLFRDIFGNPFSPVALDPAWVTTDVRALARGIYDDRAFDRMPILADALQDAGCASEGVLSHCRDATATHARGCWVVDLLLGKE